MILIGFYYVKGQIDLISFKYISLNQRLPMSTDAEAAMNRWWPLKETEWLWPILDYSNLLEIKSSI